MTHGMRREIHECGLLLDVLQKKVNTWYTVTVMMISDIYFEVDG